MTGFAQLYGRNGQQADGDSKVAELLPRTVEGQFRATEELDRLQSTPDFEADRRWTSPLPSMIMLHKLWLSEMLWQMATAYLDGVVEQYQSIDQLPDAPYSECDDLCDVASAATLQAIQLRSRLSQDDALPNDTLSTLPQLQLAGYGYIGVWRAFEAVYLQVAEDFRRFNAIDVPKRMRKVSQSIARSTQPQLDSFEYLQLTWSTSRSEDNRKQVIHNASSVVASLFAIGQQLCNLNLLGSVYAEALAYKPSLSELELPFDPWLLTDPQIRERTRSASANQQQLADFWGTVADPVAAQQVATELAAAVNERRIRLRTGRGYKTAPWPAQYLVRQPVTFGARSFEPGQLLALYVAQNDDGTTAIEVRRSGRVQAISELLGQQS